MIFFFKKHIAPWKLKTPGEHSGKVSFFLHTLHVTNHSCRVMVLVRSDLEFDLKYVEVDVQCRYVLVEADVQGSNFLFVNVYAPDKVQEQCLFFDNLNKIIENFVVDKEQKKIVIGGGGGGFNIVLDSDLDCSGGNPSKT